jgi:hypothetical protein
MWPYLRLCDDGIRVFDEISFRENFAKLATKRFSCFAKMRDEFRELRSFAKQPRLRKKRILRNMKIAKTTKTLSKNRKFNYFSFNSCEDTVPAKVIFGNSKPLL